MAQYLSLIGIAFFLGLEHAFEADHVVAVTTITSKTKSIRQAAILGAWWGLGHILTILLLGMFVLIAKISIPDTIASSLELLVAFMLIVLGIDVIYKARHEHMHVHTHDDGQTHMHLHSHKHNHQHEHQHSLKTFFVGMVHGTAGTSALILLVLSTVETLALGISYMLSFGLGSIMSMSLIAGVLSIPSQIIRRKAAAYNRLLHVVAGALSILIGLSLIYRIGFIEFNWLQFLI